MNLAQCLATFNQADLYVVITESFCAGRRSLEVLEAVLAAGVGIVQLREKDLDDRRLYELALAYRQRTGAVGALLIIDDRLDIALAAGADGVHLGQTDLPVANARRIAPDLFIGASSHSLEEALAAQALLGRVTSTSAPSSPPPPSPRWFPWGLRPSPASPHT